MPPLFPLMPRWCRHICAVKNGGGETGLLPSAHFFTPTISNLFPPYTISELWPTQFPTYFLPYTHPELPTQFPTYFFSLNLIPSDFLPHHFQEKYVHVYSKYKTDSINYFYLQYVCILEYLITEYFIWTKKTGVRRVDSGIQNNHTMLLCEKAHK